MNDRRGNQVATRRSIVLHAQQFKSLLTLRALSDHYILIHSILSALSFYYQRLKSQIVVGTPALV